MKHWFYTWVVLPNVVWMCQADQPPALLQPVVRDLLAKQPYAAAAIHTIESGLTSSVNPVASLSEFANDKNPEVRMIAAQLLPELRNPAVAAPLWNLVRDDSEVVRMNAVWALGRLNEYVPVSPDATGLKDPRANVRRLTAEILARLHNPTVEPDLINALTDSDDLARWQVVVALESCGSQQAVGPLSLRLKDSSARVRRTAAGVLAKVGDATVLPLLVAALDDQDWQTRAAAANALAALAEKLDGDRTALANTILAKLKPGDLALIMAMHALGLGNDERALTGLVNALIGNNQEAAICAKQAIVGLRITPVLPLLAKQSRHTNPDVRRRIIVVLGAIGGAAEVPVVVAALGDPVADVQLVAVTALRQLHQFIQPDRLVEQLANADPHVRAAAARFYGEYGDRRFANNVATLLFDENRFVRGAAVEALGKLGDCSAVGMLVEVLTRQYPHGESTGTPNTRGNGIVIGSVHKVSPLLSGLELVAHKAEAIKILGDLHATEGVVPIIENGLQANDSQLVALSAYALGQIGDRRAVGPLVTLVQGYYAKLPFEGDAANQITIKSGTVPNLLGREYEVQCNARRTVIWALGRLGDAATVPMLRQALNDRDSTVREAADEALARFDTGAQLLAAASVKLPSLMHPLPGFIGYGVAVE